MINAEKATNILFEIRSSVTSILLVAKKVENNPALTPDFNEKTV